MCLVTCNKSVCLSCVAILSLSLPCYPTFSPFFRSPLLLSLSLSVCLSLSLFLCLSRPLSVCLSVSLSVCLSVSFSFLLKMLLSPLCDNTSRIYKVGWSNLLLNSRSTQWTIWCWRRWGSHWLHSRSGRVVIVQGHMQTHLRAPWFEMFQECWIYVAKIHMINIIGVNTILVCDGHQVSYSWHVYKKNTHLLLRGGD